MHLHIDCSFGVSGDMLLSALADSGADISAVRKALEQLSLGDFSIKSEKVLRGGIAALQLTVEDHTGPSCSCCQGGDDHHHHHHDHDHPHSHHHGHDHGHKHDHEQEGKHSAKETKGPHRHLGDLLALLDPEILSERVRARAERVFRIVAEAEAAVHSVPLEKVHFHEISGIDTAVDVIGVCIAMEMLNVDSVSASAPAAGSGMIICEHGVLPVPAPATLEILKSRNIPWRQGGDGERMTPTGAALLAGLADSFGSSPELTVTRIGYGAGSRDFADVPNLLRVVIGKPLAENGSTASDSAKDRIDSPEMPLTKDLLFPPAEKDQVRLELAKAIPDRVVEFRLIVDDMTPEAVGFLQEQCLTNGAVEAYTMAAAMKKGRLGHELTVLCPTSKAGEIAELLWRNSTTFGIRFRESSRLTLAREIRTVKIDGIPVRIKIGWYGTEVIRRQPEYEDCRSAALATGKPLDEIYRLATQAAMNLE